jgi:hypothetical protein
VQRVERLAEDNFAGMAEFVAESPYFAVIVLAVAIHHVSCIHPMSEKIETLTYCPLV